MPPRQDQSSEPPLEPAEIFVCRGAKCGGNPLVRALAAELKRVGLGGQVPIERHPCRGLCLAGPTVTLMPRGILYCRVKPEDAAEIVQETILEGRIISRLAWREPAEIEALPLFRDTAFTRKQVRIALRNCGLIDPESIEDYIARDGYRGAGQGPHRIVTRRGHPRSQGIRPARPGRRRLSHRRQMGALPQGRRGTSNTSSATPTKATRARSWTVRSWRATRTA